MSVPDRAAFERSLSHVNMRLTALAKERREILGDPTVSNSGEESSAAVVSPGSTGHLFECRQTLADVRRRRLEHRNASQTLTNTITEYRGRIDEQARIMADCEAGNELVFKDEARLDAKISKMTEIHRTGQFANSREEGLYVKEIDKLNRNKKKLP